MMLAGSRSGRSLTTLVTACLLFATTSFFAVSRTLYQGDTGDARSNVVSRILDHLSPAHEAPPAPVSKCGKVTVAANLLQNNSIITRALETHRRHADMQGHKFFVGERQVVGDLIERDFQGRPAGAWSKPAYLLSIMIAELQKPEDERLEWIFWFDADTIVVNPYTPLDIFVPPPGRPEMQDICVLVASNMDGLNSGAMGLRVHPWTVSLLSAVLAYPIYQPARQRMDRFRDQSAIKWLLLSPDSPLVRASSRHGRERWADVPMRWFNALPFNNAYGPKIEVVSQPMTNLTFDKGTTELVLDGNPPIVQPWKVMRGDMVVHFAGTTVHDVRDSWMGPWLDRAEAMSPEWANATTQHVLRQEVAVFWDGFPDRLAAQERKDREEKAERKKQEEEAERKEQEEEAKRKEQEKEAERKEQEKKAAADSREKQGDLLEDDEPVPEAKAHGRPVPGEHQRMRVPGRGPARVRPSAVIPQPDTEHSTEHGDHQLGGDNLRRIASGEHPRVRPGEAKIVE